MRKKIITLCCVSSTLFACLAISSCSKEDNQLYTYKVDESSSYIEWKGYHADDSWHNGTVQVKGSFVADSKDLVTSGEFKIPLASIVNLNLPTDEIKDQLVHHLQSADFFNMELYPEISFKIDSLVADEVQTNVYVATGNLSILGKSKSITFPIVVQKSNEQLLIEGDVTIDRLVWGMTYASNPDEALYIKPNLDLRIKLVADEKK